MNWPKEGFFIIRAENGKYWAETLPSDLLERLAGATCGEDEDAILATAIMPAIRSLNEQVSESRKKEITSICKKQVGRKFARLN